MGDGNEDIAAAPEQSTYRQNLNAARLALRNTASSDVAMASRDWQTLSPELAAAMATTDVPLDARGMGEIVRRDLKSQSWIEGAWNFVGKGTRPLTAGMYDLWDAGIPQHLRLGTRIYQDLQDGGDFSFMRAYDQSLGTIASEAAKEVARGNMSVADVFTTEALGTGIMIGRPENQYELPGAGAQVHNLMAEGATVEEAMTATDLWLKDKYGADIVNGAWQNAEAVRLHITVDGVEHDYGVSVGRLFGTAMYMVPVKVPFTDQRFLTPGTLPAQLITGGIDATSQIWLDPTDPIANVLTRARPFSRARLLQPDQIDTIEDLMDATGGVAVARLDDTRTVVAGVEFQAVGGNQTESIAEAVADARRNGETSVKVFDQAELTAARESIEVIDATDAVAPYRAFADNAQSGLDNAVSDIAEQVPDFRQALDEGVDIESALIHLTEEEAEYIATKLKDYDGAFQDLEDFQKAQPNAEAFIEPKTEILVDDLEKMVKDGYFHHEGIEVHDEAMAFLNDDFGITRVRGRLEPRDATTFVRSGRGQRLVRWLADDNVAMHTKIDRLKNKYQIQMPEIRKMMDGIDSDLDSVIEVERHLTAWVNGQKLTRAPSAPVIEPLRMMDAAQARFTSQVGSAERVRPWSDWGRRWNAESSESTINSWDTDTTFDTITSWGKTVGATDTQIDDAVRLMYTGENKYETSVKIQSAMVDMLTDNWASRGIDEEVIERSLAQYFSEQNLNTLYNVDALANPITESDAMFRIQQTPGGNEIMVPAAQPLLVSEMSMSTLHVPSIRAVRRSTTFARRQMQKHREARIVKNGTAGHPMLLDDAIATRITDNIQGSWRTMQLLRPGWMMSVIPDELLRALADGHSAVYANPMTAFNVFFRGAGDKLPSGSFLEEIAQTNGGLGAGMWKEEWATRNSFLGGGAKSPWQPINMIKTEVDKAGNQVWSVTQSGAEAMSAEWIRLYSNPFTATIDEYGGDLNRIVDYFTEVGGDGRQLLDDIKQGSRQGKYPQEGTRLANLDADTVEGRAAIRTMVEATDARIHLMTGGDYIHRDPLNPDRWLNSAGGEVELFQGINPTTQKLWTRADLSGLIRAHSAETGEMLPVGLGGMNLADLKVAALELKPSTTSMPTLTDQQNYHIFKRGNVENRNLIAGGQQHPDMGINGGRARALTDQALGDGIDEGNRLFIIIDDIQEAVADTSRASGMRPIFDGTIPAGSRVYKDAGKTAANLKDGQVAVILDQTTLVDETNVMLLDALVEGKITSGFSMNPKGISSIDGQALGLRGQTIVDDGNARLLRKDMIQEDADILVTHIRDSAYSDNYRPPPNVKGPARPVDDALRKLKVADWVDNMFRILGTTPSNTISRSPYARIKIWETYADYYIHATPSIQRQIVSAAQDSGFKPKDFQRIIRERMTSQGYKPKQKVNPARIQFDIDEIENVAVATAIQNTRDLFFDLSKRKNSFDAVKLIFPFGDAWWEVLTRWGKLFNPYKAQQFGRPFKNLSRLESANTAAQRSGWYETDENGDRVFKWFPGAALSNDLMRAFGQGEEGLNVTNTVGIGQLGFIDFTDPRSIMGPSVGPVIQTVAAALRPFLEDTSVAPLIDFLVYGSWSPSEFNNEDVMNSLLPTYMNKFLTAVQTGEHDEAYASRTIDVMNGLYASDAKYADALTDASIQKMLIDDARKFVVQYGFIEAAASAILPAQPRMIVEVMSMDQDGSEVMVKLASVGADLRFLRGQAGMSADEAMATVRQWYGIDPLTVAPKSWRVYDRPVTEDAHRALLETPELLTSMPYTLAAFLPQDNLESDFYGPEWQRQLDSGDRQELLASESWNMVRYNAGAERMRTVREERDRGLRNAEAQFDGTDTDGYRNYRDTVVKPWYYTTKTSIEAMYSYDIGGPTGLEKRPTYKKLKDEMLKIGDPTSDQYRVAIRVNPSLTAAIVKVAELWNRNDTDSFARAHDATWWYQSQAVSDQQATGMRGTFLHRVRAIADSIKNEETKRAFKWYTDTVITPLMSGYDLDDPYIVDAAPLLAPEA